MFESLISTLHLLLSVVGLLGTADSGALAVAVVVVSVALVLLTLVGMHGGRPGERGGPHPRRAIDLSSPLAQSDPDAPGHPRPRAPGRAASAA